MVPHCTGRLWDKGVGWKLAFWLKTSADINTMSYDKNKWFYVALQEKVKTEASQKLALESQALKS